MESWRYISGGNGVISFDGFSSDQTDMDTALATENHGMGLVNYQDFVSTLNDAKTLTPFDGNPFLLSIDDASESPVFDLHLGNQGYPPCISKASRLCGSTPSSSKRLKMGADCQSSHCQVYGCHKDLTNSKEYHKKHKVCEAHSKTARAIVNGIEQRFCQQCSRFHLLSEFDDGKRSCRKRLAGHNERRRKPHLGRKSRGLQMDNSESLATSFICPDILPNGIKVEQEFPLDLSTDEDITSKLLFQPSSSSVRPGGFSPYDSVTAINAQGAFCAHSLLPCQPSSRYTAVSVGSSHYSLAHVSTKLTELGGGHYMMANSDGVELLPFIHRARISGEDV